MRKSQPLVFSSPECLLSAIPYKFLSVALRVVFAPQINEFLLHCGLKSVLVTLEHVGP